jgi:hypothetical protein
VEGKAVMLSGGGLGLITSSNIPSRLQQDRLLFLRNMQSAFCVVVMTPTGIRSPALVPKIR